MRLLRFLTEIKTASHEIFSRGVVHKFVTLNPHSKSDNGIIICSDELRALLLKYKDLKNGRDESKIS